jgi:hypothetical protein
MPTILKTKNSVTTTVVPTSLQQGELAVNITDKKMWVGNAATTPVQLLGDGGSGSFTSIAFGAGTVSAPSITFTGDTNTGIYSPAADTIAFTEGGTEVMRISSDGNVGVGGTPVAGYGKMQVRNSFLYVNEDGADTRGIYLRSSLGGVPAVQVVTNDPLTFTTNNNERMRIASGGNVLVGSTVDNGFKFKVVGGNSSQVLVDNDGSRYTQLLLQRNATSNTGGDLLVDGTNSTMSLRMLAAGAMTFNTSASAGDAVERVRIDSSGRVGIATASPEASLQVNGTNGQLILSAGNVPSSGASTNKWRLGLRELAEGDFNILHFNGTSYDNIVNIQPAGQARFINTIGVGNTGGSTSGAGITFPATQSASSNANTLDDYEEGTWTPTAPVGLSISTANYQKVGNTVLINAFININSNSNTATFLISGMPFGLATGSCSVGAFNNNNEDLYAYFDGSGIFIRTSGNNSRQCNELSSKFVAFQMSYTAA